MPVPYGAKAVANFFLRKKSLTQMKLHKLLYYAQGWHLGRTGKPLLDETLGAWTYGPVVSSIHHGSSPLGRLRFAASPRTSTCGR